MNTKKEARHTHGVDCPYCGVGVRKYGSDRRKGFAELRAAAEDRWRRTAIQVQERFINDGGGDRGAAAEERWR